MMLVENEDIDHRVDIYKRNYDALGEIGFVLREQEYRCFQALALSYRKARERADFKHDTWSAYAKKQGLFANEKAVFVFGFLVIEWSNRPIVSVKRDGEYVTIEIKNRGQN